MKKRFAPASRTLFLLFFLSISGLCSQAFFNVLHTNNVNGQLDNCLCVDQPLGALEKIAFLTDSIRRNTPNTILVDGGDFFTPYPDVVKAPLLVKALKRINYDFLAIGDQELINGPEFLEELIKVHKLPLTSANLEMVNGTEIAKSRLLKAGGVNVAATSVINPEALKFYPESITNSVKVGDPQAAIEQWIKDSEGKADFRILISHLGFDTDENIRKRFPEIDLIIGAHTQEMIATEFTDEYPTIVQAGSEGHYLGHIRLSVTRNGEIDGTDANLIPVSLELPNDPVIEGLAREYHFGFIDGAVASGTVMQPLPAEYLVKGSESCRSCHEKQFEAWLAGPHAGAHQTLAETGKSKIYKCVACHVTGFGRGDGFININLTGDLKSVGCTECHFTTSAHGDKNKGGIEKISPETCLRCHDTENDPTFDFVKDIAKVKHGK